MDEKELLIALLRSQICGDTLQIQGVSGDILQKLYILAQRQDLTHMVGQALSERGLLEDSEISQKFKACAMQAIYRYVRLAHEQSKSCCVLEDARIPFIPLKGSVLREYYPEPWMRTSCDVDVLVREEDLDAAVHALTAQLHYQNEGKTDHDVLLKSPIGITLELHFDTIQERYANNTSRDVLEGIWEDARPIREGSCHMVLSDAMFYFYHIAHMAKHFEVGGCGVRPFMDLWILNHKVDYCRDEREALLREGGLLAFAQGAEKLSEAWFSGAPMDERTQQISHFILCGSLYGDEDNRAVLGQAKSGGKLRYLITHRIFLPYDYLKAEYPVLQKHKWLTPVYQVVRWVRSLFRGELGRRVRELQKNAGVSQSATASAEDMLRYLGLK